MQISIDDFEYANFDKNSIFGYRTDSIDTIG